MNLFNHVFTSFGLCEIVAEILGLCEVVMILFLWFKLMMLLLFGVIFVVVMLVVMVVTFWCQERLGLCVCEFWPSIYGGVGCCFLCCSCCFYGFCCCYCCCCDGFDLGELL